ncbi:hypothetical protein TrispH2_011438 [Trichoplax sp. H2]|nr:hypothetical protein TrispH2_011438 [Trichoplax sp. H2]|eukprot:RDD36534.1 hypothetical protein TrispH2_011438 [Trichoplax sp. H2]
MDRKVYVAKFDYQNPYDGEELNMLSFQQGDRFLYVDHLTDEWVALKRIDTKEIGLAPSNYVETVDGDSRKKGKLKAKTRSLSEGWHADPNHIDLTKNSELIARDISIGSKAGDLVEKPPEWKKMVLSRQRRVHSLDDDNIDLELSAKLNAMAKKVDEADRIQEEERDKPEFLKINLKKVDKIYY